MSQTVYDLIRTAACISVYLVIGITGAAIMWGSLAGMVIVAKAVGF